MPTSIIHLALLHLAAVPGDLVHNRQLVETAVIKAAELGADWIVTPELCVCGYAFSLRVTGLPLLVCNRTGQDTTLDFRAATSLVVRDGKRQLSFASPGSAIWLLEWDLQAQNVTPRPPVIHTLS